MWYNTFVTGIGDRKILLQNYVTEKLQKTFVTEICDRNSEPDICQILCDKNVRYIHTFVTQICDRNCVTEICNKYSVTNILSQNYVTRLLRRQPGRITDERCMTG